MLQNILKTLKTKVWILWFIIWNLIILIPMFVFMDSELIINNLWFKFFVIEIILTILIWIIFWLFLAWTLYKIKFFSSPWAKTTWFFGWVLWVLVAGCPACSITLASYAWLAWVISVFPYEWLELKILSIFFLLYANYSTYKNLESCKLK